MILPVRSSSLPAPAAFCEIIWPAFFAHKFIANLSPDHRVYSDAAAFVMDTTTAYDYNVKLVADTYRYLDEIYIEKYPALGLRFTYGTTEDERILTDLVLAITEGCTTDREKADAINAWVRRNIAILDTCPLPMETFYARGGVCLGQAIFMSTLFRLADIPATWGDGWRGDMTLFTPYDVLNWSEGHAWCFACVDGKWELYDPMWLEAPVTDKDYIAKTFYFNMVEGITPVYDTEELPPYMYAEPNWYIGDRFYANQTYIINWSVWLNMQGYSSNSGSSYVDTSRDTSSMVEGEAFRDGWIWAGSKMYLYENGVAAAGVVREENGKKYYFTGQNGMAFEILCDEDEYSIINGFFTVKPGYVGTPLATTGNTEGITVKWESDSSVATVDENGVITANKSGIAGISTRLYRDSDGAYLGGGCSYQLQVSELERTPDYSDSYTDHEHQYTPILRAATEDYDAYILYTCTVGDCAHSHTAPGSTPTDTHIMSSEVTPPTCQKEGYITYSCTCGYLRAENNADKADHTWSDWVTDEVTGKTVRDCEYCDAYEIQGVAAYGVCGENLTWELSEEGVLTVSGQGKMYDYYLLDTPWLEYADILKEIVIEEGVSSIGDFAFMSLDNLQKLELPNSLVRIGSNALASGSSLSSVVIPASVQTIEVQAFSQNYGLKEIYFEGNPPVFEDNVFRDVTATVYTHMGTEWPDQIKNALWSGLTWDVYGDHSHVFEVKAKTEPDCTTEGSVVYECQQCGSSYTTIIPFNGHSFGGWIVETNPTCTEKGEARRACTNCDAFETQEIEATGHLFMAYSSDGNATCTEDGTKTSRCSFCDETDTVIDEGSATGHDWDDGEVTREPAIGVEGIQTFTCVNCGDTRNEPIPALPDEPVDEPCEHTSTKLNNQKDATCTETGYTGDKICTVCGETVEKGTSISMKAHTEVIDKAAAATCTTTGKTEGKHCSVCQTVLKAQETIPATGHNWGEWKVSKPATSAEMGEEKRSCSTCGLEETRVTDKLSNPFVDVQTGKYYETPVLWAVENGITNGMDATHFAPDATCNRGQVVTFLWRAAGSPEPTSTNNPFTDVKEGKFYYKAVLWAVENGITNGTSATTFSPNDNCTRGQVATFLWRTLNEPAASSSANPFTDVTQGKFYYKAVLWAVEAGVTNGMTKNTFAPGNSFTRGQIVTFLYRALG